MGVFIFFSAIIVFIFIKRTKKSSVQKNVPYEYSVDESSLSDSASYNMGYSNFDLPSANATFYGEDTSVNINGILLSNPFVYVSKDSPRKTSARPHIIFEKSKIKQSDTKIELNYWPSYAEIPDEARYQLLRWLSEGKKSIDLNIGLLFIYFYNLEYRAVKDRKDLLSILNELIRLYTLFNFSGSFRGYAEGLIVHIVFSLQIDEVPSDMKKTILEMVQNASNYSKLRTSGINFYLKEQTKPCKDNLIDYVVSKPQAKNSIIPDKVGQIFNDYFIELVIRKLPDIMDNFTLQACDLYYHWASYTGYHEGHNIVKGVSPVMPSRYLPPLIKLWDQCIEDFRPYSRKMTKGSEIELFDLLPGDAKNILPHKFANMLRNFCENHSEKPVQIPDLLGSINSQEKLTLNSSKRLSRIINETGYSVEPDVAHTNRPYKIDDFVVLFKKSGELKNPDDYYTATLFFDLGMIISHADDEIHIKEVDTIENFIISNLCKSDVEKHRINKRKLLATTGKLNFSGITKSIVSRLKLKDIEPIAEYLYSVASADGKILLSEVMAIRKIIKGFGLSESFIDGVESKLGITQTIASVRLQSQTGEIKKGSAIPPQKVSSEVAIKINEKKLEELKVNTNLVKSTLRNVFKEDELEAEVIAFQEIKKEEKNDITVLESKFLPFYNHLITEETWEKSLLRKVALEHGFMVDEAIESINTWSDDNLGDFLIVEKEKYHISLELLK